jgi:ABC-type spermidine/putrescine transport system permease subunit II
MAREARVVSAAMPRDRRVAVPVSQLALLAVALLVVLPFVAVALYAFSTRWDRGLWPEGATLQWIGELAGQPRVRSAVVQTLAMSWASALLVLLVGAPASLFARLFAPRLLVVLDALALLPYAIPPVVVAIGALDVFVGRWGAYLDLRAVYVAVTTPLLFPLLHRTLGAAMGPLDAGALLEAGRTLGASDAHLMRRVLLPLLAPALAASLLLCWVTAAMEFAVANLLLGGEIEMLQPLMNGLRGVNGHQSAALVCLSFAVVFAIGAMVEGLMAWNSARMSSK